MEFFNNYFELLAQGIISVDHSYLNQAASMLKSGSENGKKVILAGNGGSAAMASHVAVDLTKVAGIRSMNFNEPDLLTCFANDYGYEHVFDKAIEFYGDSKDVLILISSSGQSSNIINAANKAKEMGIDVITFSGFNSDNPLRQLGDLNFWVDSKAYNIVEMTHHVWLLSIVDYIIGNINYTAS